MNQEEKRIYLIKALSKENKQIKTIQIPTKTKEQESYLRALMNVRLPRVIAEPVLSVQDQYLQEVSREKGIINVDDLEPVKERIYLYQGDITRLKCDAIVNAANSQMTGCYIPNHHCIDNAIHTFAGMQLRLECARLMAEQGYDEPPGRAKITPAYNLPAKYIIHTVGPIVYDQLT